MRYDKARNVLIGVGAFYVSRWMAALLRAGLAAFLHGGTSVDGVRQVLLTPFISSLSQAIAAASAGAVVVLLVVSRESLAPPESRESPASPESPPSPESPASPSSRASLNSSVRWKWAIVPAALWFVASLDDVTISAPGWVHLVSQLIAAALPSIVCLAAGHLADWHRTR